MKKSVALVTDSVSNLPPELAAELGVTVVAASYAFDDERHLDGGAASDEIYGRMERERAAPRSFGPTEAAWSDAFTAGLQCADAVLCLVTPFDVASSFTTASAAMLAIQFDHPEARIKIMNPGVGNAGLASLLVTLAKGVTVGWDTEQMLTVIEELEPHCDSLFVPAELGWLERSGRLALVEERIGDLEDGLPVLRVGTRVTGVSKAGSFTRALDEAVKAVGKRAGAGTALNATILHADSPQQAAIVADKIKRAREVRHLVVAPLTATIGSQLGPGTIGIGVAPAEFGTR